jgi:hypothetical protein
MCVRIDGISLMRRERSSGLIVIGSSVIGSSVIGSRPISIFGRCVTSRVKLEGMPE